MNILAAAAEVPVFTSQPITQTKYSEYSSKWWLVVSWTCLGVREEEKRRREKKGETVVESQTSEFSTLPCAIPRGRRTFGIIKHVKLHEKKLSSFRRGTSGHVTRSILSLTGKLITSQKSVARVCAVIEIQQLIRLTGVIRRIYTTILLNLIKILT